MESYMAEALRLWVRGARIPEVIEVLELIRRELVTHNVHLEFTMEYRPPQGGPGK